MTRSCFSLKTLVSAVGCVLLAIACGGSDATGDETGTGTENNNNNGGGNNGGGFATGDPDAGPVGGGGNSEGRDPVDCKEAASSHSYVGCDYWPTVTANAVDPSFHFVAAVANTGKADASVTVTGPNAFSKTVSVPAGGLVKIELPWVNELKGGAGNTPPRTKPALVSKGAYHLVSTTPVIVYQFSALEYQLGDKYSYTNDASLLLPSTAMTGNYRVVGMHGMNEGFTIPILNIPVGQLVLPSTLTITATAPKTTVKIKLSSTANLDAVGSVAAANAGDVVSFTLENPGDVIQLMPKDGDADFSGSLINASAAIQVISGVPCIYLPKGKPACDHVEETVMPQEAFGKKYVVAPPTGFDGTVASQVVRIYANKDGTKLTYSPQKPSGCPDTLNAGQFGDCGAVGDAFTVESSSEFAVKTFLLGASNYPNNNPQQMGDPSETSYPAIEQFRKNYIFLAPTDYPVLWADVTAPQGTTLTLDDAPVTEKWTQIGTSSFGVFRLNLTKSGKDGVHTLTASQPVGVQVIGYGSYTTFQYPAGLNLNLISDPTPIVN